jgi:hypothetical protein
VWFGCAGNRAEKPGSGRYDETGFRPGSEGLVATALPPLADEPTCSQRGSQRIQSMRERPAGYQFATRRKIKALAVSAHSARSSL